MDQISELKKAYMRAGTKLVTMSRVVPARPWSSHDLALQHSETYNIRAQIARTAGIERTTSLTVYLGMTNMEVEHVLATSCLLARASSC